MAISTRKIKLKTVLESNRTHPIILVGVTADQLDGAVMPASISPRDLNTGTWPDELADMVAARGNVTLVIDGIDTLSPATQAKFLPLVKDRRSGQHKLPAPVQILIPVSDLNRVADEIQRVALVYHV